MACPRVVHCMDTPRGALLPAACPSPTPISPHRTMFVLHTHVCSAVGMMCPLILVTVRRGDRGVGQHTGTVVGVQHAQPLSVALSLTRIPDPIYTPPL